MRAPKTILLAVMATALAVAGTATASTTTARNGPLTATFTAGTHAPNCKQKWPVAVSARFHGKKAHATAFYQFLSGGAVVGTQYPYSATSRNRQDRIWHFYGGFIDRTFGPFGALAVGVPITVQAVVKVGRYTAYPSYSVKVVRVAGCRAVR